jgi:SAM-dependent methyltransferase
MSLIPRPSGALVEEAIWQDVEYGSYDADLAIWADLASRARGPVLEIGAGSGRVSLHLARQGFPVAAAEADERLAAELDDRARAEELPLSALAADVTAPGLADALAAGGRGRPSLPPEGFRAAFAPLQVMQLFGEGERRRALDSLRDVIAPGGILAAALVDESTISTAEGTLPPPSPPDMREVDGWVFSSEPLWVQTSDEMLRMRRLRQRVSPRGDLIRSVHDDLLHRLPPERLEREAREARMAPSGRRDVAAGESEAGSVVVILEKATSGSHP